MGALDLNVVRLPQGLELGKLLEPCPEPNRENTVRTVRRGGLTFRVVRCGVHGGYYNSVGVKGGHSTGGEHYKTLAGALSGLRGLIKWWSRIHGKKSEVKKWGRS